MFRIIRNSILMMGTAAFLAAGSSPSRAEGRDLQFEEVSADAGIDYVGASWGSAWGFYDGDGLPDFWLVDHWNKPGLYVNQGDGTFVDVILQAVQPEYYWSDTHGACWVDYDNDGDQDLYHLADFDPDSYLPHRDFFFINDEGDMVENADSLGLVEPLGRGRTPLFLDYDGDGLLDAYRPTSQRSGSGDGPTVLFRHGPYGFTDVSAEVGLAQSNGASEFALLSDLSGDGKLDLITHHEGPFPEKVYDLAATGLTDLRDALGIPTNDWVNDAAAGDFDGDLDNDLFMVRGEKEEGFVQIDPFTVEVGFLAAHAVEKGVGFTASGETTFDVYPRWKYPLEKIFIGAAGAHPEDYTFTLSPSDTIVCGMCAHTPGAEQAMYIGYDSTAQEWRVLHAQMAINIVLTGADTISAVSAIGWDPADPPLSDHFLVNLGDEFEDRASAAGFTEPSSGRNVVAGDFDNDMDLDLYIVCTGPVENRANILYRNDGTGCFERVANAGGAGGGTAGRGDAATVADYDGDGFLDLLVTNGKSKGPYDEDGPTYLFHNLGNDNHWIEIDLEGLATNRDGVGARVIAKAGGVAQLREQTGGMHCRGQNHQRLHFGLGANTVVDTLTITWPSGVVQDTCGIAADQIIHIVEAFTSGVDAPRAAPAAVRLSGGRPNPFNPATTVSFLLPAESAVDLTVHDTAGRLVRRLAAGGLFPAGENEILWNGRDDSGRPVSSGVYLLRLDANGATRTGKVVLLR